MSWLRRSIPSIPTLVAFEAAARLASFTQAAQELGITQAAVSRQVKEMEEFLQVALFERNYRSVSLTPAGMLLHGRLPAHLTAIASLCERVREMGKPQAVVVGMTSAFGTHWLTPRLPEFRKLHPDVELRLAVNDEIVDLAKHRIDISIRYGNGRWSTLRSEFLLGAEDMPVCSPSYWGERRPAVEPRDLVAETLICLDGPPAYAGSRWSDWFAACDVEAENSRRQFTVTTFSMLIQATLGGQGIALGGSPLIDDLLAQGLLVPAIDGRAMRIPGGYFVVEPEDEDRAEGCAHFRRWLFDRARRDALAAGAERLLTEVPAPPA